MISTQRTKAAAMPKRE